jgi:hypothetical protein
VSASPDCGRWASLGPDEKPCKIVVSSQPALRVRRPVEAHARDRLRRTITYDKENRTSSIVDNGSTTTYHYNSDNQLAIQRYSNQETEYPDPYYISGSNGEAYKNIYIGSQRIAIKRVFPPGQPEIRQYFLTADQTGSTDLVTDAGANLYEHLEYFPSGEIWVAEQSNTNPVPYLFDGQLFDQNRGVSLFGQRFYEPRDQFLYAPDSVLTNNPPATTGAPGLLDAHSVAFDNPLSFTDQSGQNPQPVPNDQPTEAGTAEPLSPGAATAEQAGLAAAEPATDAAVTPAPEANPVPTEQNTTAAAEPEQSAVERFNERTAKITESPLFKFLTEVPPLVHISIGFDGSFQLELGGLKVFQASPSSAPKRTRRP